MDAHWNWLATKPGWQGMSLGEIREN